jgi:hypothetical protein
MVRRISHSRARAFEKEDYSAMSKDRVRHEIVARIARIAMGRE